MRKIIKYKKLVNFKLIHNILYSSKLKWFGKLFLLRTPKKYLSAYSFQKIILITLSFVIAIFEGWKIAEFAFM